MNRVTFISVFFLFPLGSRLFAAAYFISSGPPGDSCPLTEPHDAGLMESATVVPPSTITHPHPLPPDFLFPYVKMYASGLIREFIQVNTLARWFVTAHR